MITELDIAGLRGIERGTITGLRGLTFFVGPNGCGKTTVLEALGVGCAGRDAQAAFHALSSREWMGSAGMRYWFRDGKSATVGIGLHGADEGDPGASTYFEVKAGTNWPDFYSRGEAFTRKGGLAQSHPRLLSGGGWATELTEDGVPQSKSPAPLLPFSLSAPQVGRPAGAETRIKSGRYSSDLREALSAIKLTPWYDDWFAYLRVLRPSLTSIESIAIGDRDEPFMFEGTPRQGFPLAYAGDGFRRSLLLVANLARAKGGVAAIDEPEAFAHPRLHRALASLFKSALGDGTQLMVATHSLEFIGAALQEFADKLDEVAVVGLRLDGGVLSPIVVQGVHASERILEMGDDLRM